MTTEDTMVETPSEADGVLDPRAALLLADAEVERTKAARALLARPLLRVGGEEFRLVRKYAADLIAWFAAETGWRLIVDAQTARLLKTPARLDDATRHALAPKTKARSRAAATCCCAWRWQCWSAQTTRSPSAGSPTE